VPGDHAEWQTVGDLEQGCAAFAEMRLRIMIAVLEQFRSLCLVQN
jgi:hypothetical protein